MAIQGVDFRTANFTDLAELWNRFYPEKFWVDGDLLRQNTVESPAFDWGASTILIERDKPVAFLAIKKSAARLYKGPSEDEAHICAIAYDNVADAVDLLGSVKRLLRNRGFQKLAFGRDSRHFFPGCPEECKGLASFLTVEGFLPGYEPVDLTRNLADYKDPALPAENGEFRRLAPDDKTSLAHFFQRNFSGRWAYDVLDKISVDGIENCVFGVFVDGALQGFALLQDWRHQLCIGGSVWRKGLGEQWGSLGPIGVSEEVRGHGYGNALLGAALEELKGRGVQNCIIDWTGIPAFYEKHGFEIYTRYQSFELDLEQLG